MFDFKAFAYPKDPQSNCIEDAWRADKQKGLLVISDGASSSLFSGKWANLLCEGVLRGIPAPENNDQFSQWLGSLRQQWAESIDYNSLAWYQRPKVSTGAFATLVWASVEPAREIPDNWTGSTAPDYPFYRVSGRTVGDACLFHFRGAKLLQSIPIKASADFDSTPMLVGSADLGKDGTIVYAPFDFLAAAGDWIILATDAMAQWILYQVEKNEPPLWDKFWPMNDVSFRQFVEAVRGSRQIRIDDTTIIAACLGGERYINQGAASPAVSEASASGLSTAGEAPIELEEAPILDATPVTVPQEILVAEVQTPATSSVSNPAAASGMSNSGMDSAHTRIIQQNDVPTLGPGSHGFRMKLHPSANVVIQPPKEAGRPGSMFGADAGTSSQGGLRSAAVYNGAPSSSGAGFSGSAPVSSSSSSSSSSAAAAEPTIVSAVVLEDEADDGEYKLDLGSAASTPSFPVQSPLGSVNGTDNSVSPAAGDPGVSKYLTMHERVIQAQIEREQREKKEREDSFGFQFQQGMEEGLRDMKGFVNDGFKDVKDVVGEQAKEAFQKGKEQAKVALEKGKEKLGQLWGTWFNKDKDKDKDKDKE